MHFCRDTFHNCFFIIHHFHSFSSKIDEIFFQMSENKHKRSTIIWKEGESVDEKSLPAFKRPFLKNWRVDWVNKATLAVSFLIEKFILSQK